MLKSTLSSPKAVTVLLLQGTEKFLLNNNEHTVRYSSDHKRITSKLRKSKQINKQNRITLEDWFKNILPLTEWGGEQQ